jgi:hypothetical protein
MKKILLLLSCVVLSAQSLFAVQMSGDVKAKYHFLFDSDSVDHWMKTEANIRLDHIMDKAWVTTNIRAYSYDSTRSGISLDKAYIGYRFYNDGSKAVNIEVGKNRLEHMFESKMQFDSHFIGAHAIANLTTLMGHKFIVHGGPFVLDSREQEFGFIGEASAIPLMAIPLSFKYSLSRWSKEYTISEFMMQYNLFDQGFAYVAYLINHHGTNNGFYIGYSHGNIKEAHDWSFDVSYQYAEKNLIPFWDMKGLRSGVQFIGHYALTDSFKLRLKDQWDFKAEKNLLEIGAIYTW